MRRTAAAVARGALPKGKGGKMETPTRKKMTRQERFEAAMRKFEPPRHFATTFEAIKGFRGTQSQSEHPAPVDVEGCHTLGDRPHGEPIYSSSHGSSASSDAVGGPSGSEVAKAWRVYRFQILVGLMLSAQTKDAVTAAAMGRLKAEIPGGCVPEALVAAGPKAIDACVCKVGFHQRKAGYIADTAQRCIDEYGGDIPSTLEGLVSLPGVGPKMAHLALLVAFDDCTGIGVDVHVHRIAFRLGWVPNNRKIIAYPEDTRKALEWWVPRDPYWVEINKLLVGFGQTVCTPINPQCDKCVVNTLCPTAFNRSETKSQKPVGFPGRLSHPACEISSSSSPSVQTLPETQHEPPVPGDVEDLLGANNAAAADAPRKSRRLEIGRPGSVLGHERAAKRRKR
jgi:endonuclease III